MGPWLRFGGRWRVPSQQNAKNALKGTKTVPTMKGLGLQGQIAAAVPRVWNFLKKLRRSTHGMKVGEAVGPQGARSGNACVWPGFGLFLVQTAFKNVRNVGVGMT
jgi:hypothetical protein